MKLFCDTASWTTKRLEARIAARERQLAGRLLFDIDAEHDAIGRRALGLLDLELVLEEAEALDPVLAALDLERVEGIAFVDAEFAADDLVAGDRVAGDVDPLDIDARRLADLERDVHQPLVGIAVVGRIDVGECVTEVAGLLVEAGDRILDRLGVEPAAGLDMHQRAATLAEGKSRNALSASTVPNL